MLRFSALALTAALLAAAPAAAQDAPATDMGATKADAYFGVVGGYHDLSAGNDFGTVIDDEDVIGGVVAGFDVPVAGPVTIGLEGNFQVGAGPIEYEYGVAARLGYKFPSGGIAFVRGGYQWVNLDLGEATDLGLREGQIPAPDLAKDYLVGVGGEFALGDRFSFGGGQARLRIGVDTISFDSIRPTAGLILSF